jgi:hypothetical protein
MVLTPSRTRNQTTLNNLAKMLAVLNGEYAFCLEYLDSDELKRPEFGRLLAHARQLKRKIDALRATLIQFDPELDVDSIRGLDTWQKRFGGKRASGPTLKKRLVAEVMVGYDPSVPPSRDELPFRSPRRLWGQLEDVAVHPVLVRPKAGS